MTDLSKSYIAVQLHASADYWVFAKQGGYSTPGGATKVYWSAVARFCTDNHWHFDRVRVVYK